MFDRNFIDQVRERTDLLSVIEASVTLRKAGKDFIGLCPFHEEKSPSFTVSPSKQFYHCFGCGAHGDALDWEMAFGGREFSDAVEHLAGAAGLALPAPEALSPDERAHREHIGRLREALSRANDEFIKELRTTQRAIEYLRDERGTTGETARRFGIGYAAAGLASKLVGLGEQLLLDAGLLAVVEDGSTVRDRFSNRITFPIYNERGEPVGFGARVLDERKPKYLNSPETAVFHKGQELYGLHLAKHAIRRERIATVVEGYMDVVMLHQHGDERAVAALGTSVAEQQLSRLFRMADEVIYVFDGDSAGKGAAARAARVTLEIIPENKRARFVTLPDEHDPDSYVRMHGVEAWRAYLQQGEPLSRKVMSMLAEGRDLSLPEDRAAFASEAGALLSTMRHARLYQNALLVEVEQLVGLRPKIVSPAAATPACVGMSSRDIGAPKPNASRAAFYRQYALLCALDAQVATEVPGGLLDDFATLIASWYGCAPTGLQERISAVTGIRDSALRRVIVASLDGVRERTQFLDAAQLADDVTAIAQSIQEEATRRERERDAVALFA
jgi:DNA primase